MEYINSPKRVAIVSSNGPTGLESNINKRIKELESNNNINILSIRISNFGNSGSLVGTIFYEVSYPTKEVEKTFELER